MTLSSTLVLAIAVAACAGQVPEGTIDGPRLAELIAAIESDDPVKGAEAMLSLRRSDPAVVTEALTPLLNDRSRSATARASAALVLGLLGEGGKPGIGPLQAALRDDDVFLRVRAAEALIRITGKPTDELIVILAQGLEHETRSARAAAQALGSVGAAAAPSVPALQKALERSADLDLRLLAAHSLGQIGAGAKSAVPALRKCLAADDDRLRKNCQVALDRVLK